MLCGKVSRRVPGTVASQLSIVIFFAISFWNVRQFLLLRDTHYNRHITSFSTASRYQVVGGHEIDIFK